MPATLTATLTAPPATPECRPAPQWIVPPFPLATGGTMAFVVLGGRDCYRAVLRDEDAGWSHWEVSKELNDGTFASPYWVTVPASGNDGAAACTCDGNKYRGTCRHLGLHQLLRGH